MSYEVTATRKRPQGFDQLVGQDFVVSTLKSSLKLERIAHAYIFSGPRGVGKTSAARILAKALNCEKGPGPEPCGECSQCQEISRGNSLDVIEIDGASNTSVNDIRELKDEVLFAPSNGRYKIYIIDEVHMLSNSAFNALLKTIEEPPPYIVFIFATTEIHKVPATIRSRCQQFNFRLIPVDGIRDQLRQVVTEMKIEAEDEALFWIAKEATGSLRDAYTLFDQIASFSDSHITLKKIQENLGLAGIDSIGELVTLLTEENTGQVIERAESIISQGVSIEQFLIDLTEYFRTLLLLKSGIKRESILGYHPDRFPAEILDAFSSSQIEYAVEQLLSVYRDIRYSLNQRFEMELILSKLSSLRSHLSSTELLCKIGELRSELMASGGGKSSAAGLNQAAGANRATLAAGTKHANRATQATGLNQPEAAASAAQAAGGIGTSHAARATQPASPNHTDTRGAQKKSPEQVREPVGQTAQPVYQKGPENSNQSASSHPTPHRPGPSHPAPTETPGIAGEGPRESSQQRSLSDEEIQSIIGEVKQFPTLVSTLEKVISWELKDRRLSLYCDTNYSLRKLRDEISTLKPAADKTIGSSLEIVLLVNDNNGGQENSSANQCDVQAALVKKVFRGKIIDGAEHESNGHF